MGYELEMGKEQSEPMYKTDSDDSLTKSLEDALRLIKVLRDDNRRLLNELVRVKKLNEENINRLRQKH